ncbi:MAG: CDP-glycerol glycerophosphotransferase family protein [Chitinispirillia bacterium]|nr:CDP-glycerol glycerophosphotransferase family protein [Chitinispirillia bacterium]
MILELLKTLEEATDNLKKLFSKKEFQALTNLLADCQDGAVQIGQFIESLEGRSLSEAETTSPSTTLRQLDKAQTVAFLEEYCELLYHANEELNKPESGAGPIKKLQKQIIKIGESVKTDLKPDKIEIVFFPYKASMWDSLESIWLAAKDDPACDAYVVPIPYYDKNPDGSFGQMHYEGDKYPDYVPVVDWQNYNVEERRPDAVFIHNPYDGNNYVTEVHQDYYAERLKGFTEMLVYSPYFVAGGDSVDESFAVAAGCVHAHKVIVQSEKVRDSYVAAYKKSYGSAFGKPEEKFIALGSPKFDAVINKKREDFKMPDEWAKLIDGKKVILYNTSLGAILNGDRKYLEKVRLVLNQFKERDDIVLWWRPHPLSAATFNSMRPFLLNEYEQMIAEYKRGGFGIYDDTPDLNRAIMLSDAYYGDGSSLVAMYEVTGKPVVIQNIQETESDALLRFADFTVDDDGIAWGFELFTDGLFKLDFESNRAKLAARSGCVPKYMGKKYPQTHRYIKICSVKDEVFCFPFFLDNIMVYNRVSGETIKIPISNDYLLPSGWNGFAFYWSVQYQEKIYSFGIYSKAVVALDLINHSVRYDTALFEKIGFLTDTKEHVKYPLYISECSEDGKITIVMRNCEHLIRYTLPTQEVEFITVNPSLRHCLRADFDGQNFWLIAEKNEKIVKWNPDSNETTDYYMSTDGFTFSDKNDIFFYGISDCGSFLLLFPAYGNKLLKFDKKTECFSEYTEMPVPIDEMNSVFKYELPKSTKDKIYAFARHNYTMYELDKPSGNVTPHKFCLNNESHKSYYKDFFDSVDNATGEHSLGNIADFFAISVSDNQKINPERRDNFLNYTATPDGSCGVKTYEYAKGEVLK